MMNLINLIDGLDGLAGGIGLMLSVCLLTYLAYEGGVVFSLILALGMVVRSWASCFTTSRRLRCIWGTLEPI